MSFVGTLNVTFRALTGLPDGTSCVFFSARVKSRKERGVSVARKVLIGPLTVSPAGDVISEDSHPACATFSTPFPSEDMIHFTVGTDERGALFASANAYVRTFTKTPHTERTLELKDPKTKSAVGTVSVAVDYAAPEVVLSDSEIVERVNASALLDTPRSDDSCASTSSLTLSGSDSVPSPDITPAPAPPAVASPSPLASPLPQCAEPERPRWGHRSPVPPRKTAESPGVRDSPRPVVPGPKVHLGSIRNAKHDTLRRFGPDARAARQLLQSSPESPVTVTPCTGLSFGLESRQAALDTPLKQCVQLENTSSERVCFQFDTHDEPFKFTLTAEPSRGRLDPGQQLTVALTLTVHCTTHLQLTLPLQVWHGRQRDYGAVPVATVVLTGGVQSKLSTRLDAEELQLFSPSIGGGAFGTVYRGKYRGFDVAVKVLNNQERPSPTLLKDFKAEVEMGESLRHTCITTFVGAVHTPGSLALVTEYCPFGNLSAALTEHPFSLAFKLKALLDVACAIDYLHQSGLLHRDLKTENVLVVSLEPLSQVVCKVADFGTARDVNSCAQAQELELTKGIGTPIFMAPEVITGGSYAESADIYSFGIIMCHVANCEVPYANERRFSNVYSFCHCINNGMRPQLKVDMPPEFVWLMNKCWDANPLVRPSSSELSKNLEDLFHAEEPRSLSE